MIRLNKIYIFKLGEGIGLNPVKNYFINSYYGLEIFYYRNIQTYTKTKESTILYLCKYRDGQEFPYNERAYLKNYD